MKTIKLNESDSDDGMKQLFFSLVDGSCRMKMMKNAKDFVVPQIRMNGGAYVNNNYTSNAMIFPDFDVLLKFCQIWLASFGSVEEIQKEYARLTDSKNGRLVSSEDAKKLQSFFKLATKQQIEYKKALMLEAQKDLDSLL